MKAPWAENTSVQGVFIALFMSVYEWAPNVCHPTICLFQASESKREQFRRYLEKSGVLDTLTSGKWTPPVQPGDINDNGFCETVF